MVKLKRLKIHQYRNVRPGTELRFDDLRNLVLGKNGSGKTTLLGLIAAVSGHDFERLTDEEFDLEYEVSSELGVGTVALSNKRVELAPGRSQTAYRYTITVVESATGRLCQAIGTPDNTDLVEPGSASRTHRAISPYRRDFVWRLVAELGSLFFSSVGTTLFIHQPYSPFRFDESLDCFLAMTGRTSTTPGVESPHEAKVKLSVGEENSRNQPKQVTYQEEYFFPGSLAVELAHGLQDPRSVFELDASIRLGGGDTAMKLLTEAVSHLGYSRVAIHPSIKSEYASRDFKGRTFEIQGLTFSFTRKNGSVIHHDLLSFGQKRLMAFFYYLSCNDLYVVADELVNGLHRRWIEACMYALGERQAFLTSQNPLLFDYIEFDSVEQAQARFITCKTELVDGGEQLVWENMSRDHAELFFRGYEAELEGVGDVLINRGLW